MSLVTEPKSFRKIYKNNSISIISLYVLYFSSLGGLVHRCKVLGLGPP